jgi:hypothetical protein
MRVPNVAARLSAIASTNEACPGSGEKLGVKVGLNIGGNLNVQVLANKDESDPIVSFQLAVSS